MKKTSGPNRASSDDWVKRDVLVAKSKWIWRRIVRRILKRPNMVAGKMVLPRTRTSRVPVPFKNGRVGRIFS